MTAHETIETPMSQDEYLKLISEIAYYAVAVNEFTDFCVFLRFSGHVGNLNVEICRSKEHYENRLTKADAYVKFQDENKWKVATRSALAAKRDILKSIFTTGKIPTDDMRAVNETVTSYVF